jgi:6-phosphogluconolactonase (cycloisomerase 2 family)
MKKLVGICCLLGVIAAGCFHISSQDTQNKTNNELDLYLLVGSYASPTQEGVKLYRFDDATGDASYLSGLKGLKNPSYLIPSVEGSRIYTVEEASRNDSAAVNTLYFDKGANKLTVLNRQLTKGYDPCHVALDPTCHFAVTANYTGGDITIFAMDIDGKLKGESRQVFFHGRGPISGRQDASHPHCVVFTPDQNYMLVTDLGADCIHMFPLSSYVSTGVAHSLIDEEGEKTISLEAGSGPRHLEFHPNGRYAYLINELSGMVTVLEYIDGNMRPKQYIAADENGAQGAADIHVSADGRFVYASVRLKEDGIAIFSVDTETGELTKVGYQHTDQYPRNFVLSPSGDFLLAACRDSNTIQIFRVDKESGLLKDTGKKVKADKPSCLQFVR